MENDLPERVYMANDPPGRVFTRQTTRSNEFTWAPTHDQNQGTREIRANGQHNRSPCSTATCSTAPTHGTTRPARTKFGVSMGARPERRHEGASSKWVARTCRRHTGGHALTFFAWPHVPGHPLTARHDPTDSPEHVCTGTHTRHDPTHPNEIWGFHVCTARTKFGLSMGARPERRPEGASSKRAARTCRRHTGGDDLEFLARPRVPAHPHTARHDPTHPGRADPNRPSEIWGFHGCMTRTKKAHGRSRLSIFGTATCPRAPTHGTTRDDSARPKEIWGLNGRTTRTKARG